MGKHRRNRKASRKRRRSQFSRTDPNDSTVPMSTKRHHCNSMLEKLKCENPAERQWACHSLANIVIREDALEEFPLQQLLSNGLLENLSNLIVNDPLWIIREAAFGVLRNLSLSFGDDVIEQIVTSNTLERIAAALKQSHELAVQFSSGTLQPSEDLTSENLFSTTEQCLYLLMTISEANDSPKLMEVLFQPEFLLLLMQYITSFVFPTKHRALAAQCMITLTEDKRCCQVLLQSLPETVTTLTSFLSLSVEDQYHILARVSVAGIILNLLSEITDFGLQSQLTQQMATVLVDIIDINFDSLMEPLRLDSPDSTSSNAAILDQGEAFLQSIQTALELVANLCYKEEKGEDDKDCDERWTGLEEEDIMAVEDSHQIIATVVSVITEIQLHRKILRWCQFNQNDYNILTVGNVGLNLYKKIPAVQERAVIATMNIVTVLPLECWGEEGVAALWSTLCQIASLSQEDINEDSCDMMEACLNTIVTLSRKCQEANIILATGEQLAIFFQLKDNTSSPTLRACVAAVIGAIGKTSLITTQPERFILLEPIISCLKNTVAKDTSLIVCCLALDAMFDILGDDNCPPELITIDLLTLLQTTNKILRTQVQKEQQHLEKYGVLVDTVQTNLPLFIEYLKNQK